MKILSIETSCDETSAAILDGMAIRANVVSSQIALHGPYGGVVPEIASRSHVEVLPGVLQEAMEIWGGRWDELDGVAVTYGPGLASSLLVGVSAAKALRLRLGCRICMVNHLHGHLVSPFLATGAPDFDASCPFLSLVVSGGHTCLVRVEGVGRYVLLGQTVDDAAGEAFDKGANLLELGYPGGPVMDRLAKDGNLRAIRFPRGRPGKNRPLIHGMASALCFSFSGLKTSLLYHLRDNPIETGDVQRRADVIASYQEAIVDPLVTRAFKALDGMTTLAVGGGVSLNSRLRARLQEEADRRGVRLLLAETAHCGDNAAMIGAVAALGGGEWDGAADALDVEPSLPIADVAS